MAFNRVHNRVIVFDNGKPICKAGSHASLLAAIRCCTRGHQSLVKAGYLHRNISVKNLMIDVNDGTRGFLANLDVVQDTSNKGLVQQKILGVKAFTAIELLEPNSGSNTFMTDLESFFFESFYGSVFTTTNMVSTATAPNLTHGWSCKISLSKLKKRGLSAILLNLQKRISRRITSP